MKVIAKPIEMISYSMKDGSLRPIRFKITTEDDSYTVIKINKILFNYREKLAGNPMLVYRCQGLINNTEKIFELKYELLTCKWMLYKM